MTERLQEIFKNLPTCHTFADVGCDHGYIAKAMVQQGKCQKVVIADISKKCLEKAEQLLYKEINDGVAVAIVSNGFEKLPTVDLALIAGMGGQEIISILQKAKSLPQKLVLQPMKNSDQVRVVAVNLGYKIVKDYTFYTSNVYYDLILLEKGIDTLTQEEIEFGRTNLATKPQAFIDKLKFQIEGLRHYANGKNLKEETRSEMLARAERLQKYVFIK